MDKCVLSFVRAALLYLLIGVGLGLAMGLSGDPGRMTYLLLPTHAHINLIGFVSMLIFGLSYHILPRFTGRLLHSTRLAWIHFFLANAGLLGMASFFFMNRLQPGEWRLELGASMALQSAGIVLYVYNIWRSTIPIHRSGGAA